MCIRDRDIRDYLKNTKIKVNDTLKKEIESQYDTYNNFRKQNFGRLNLSRTEGIQIDSVFQELSELYPEFFNAEETISEMDQLNNITDVLDLSLIHI